MTTTDRAPHQAAAMPSQSYTLPDAQALSSILDRHWYETSATPESIAATMCLLLASTVRDLLTGCDRTQPFDATGLELQLHTRGWVEATGAYWTADGTRRRFHDIDALDALREAPSDLSPDNSGGWMPLCTLLGGTTEYTRYRLDLTRAARFPAEA
ncbi:hypothetical protein [Streptomyces sp. NPDC012746]|uniref:hypothetical protein n=1 Tax=Streptomyces sp. NPDC012746 TaxID=3364845 RepID=UPI00367E6408